MSRLIWYESMLVASLLICQGMATADEPADGKLQPPDPAQLAQAVDAVVERFEKKIQAAKSEAEKLQLMQELTLEGTQSRHRAVDRCAFFQTAINVAPSIDQALTVFDTMGKYFDINVLESKAATIGVASSAAKTPAEHLAAARGIMPLIASALESDNILLAKKLGGYGEKDSQLSKDADVQKQMSRTLSRLDRRVREYNKWQGARRTLARVPSDEAANLIVGRYYCFRKGDWQIGLPMIALSIPSDLQAAAERELRLPNSVSEKMAVANAWGQAASKTRRGDRDPLFRRALHWYQLAADTQPAPTQVLQVQIKEKLTAIKKALATPIPSDQPRHIGYPANGYSVGQTVDHRRRGGRRGRLASSLDWTKPWSIHAEVFPTTFKRRWQMLFFYGDSRPGHDPIFLRFESDLLKLGLYDCRASKGGIVTHKCGPNDLNRWMEIQVDYLPASGEYRMFINGVLESSVKTAVRPNPDRLMHVVAGGVLGARDQDLHGQLRNVWLGNNQ